MATKTVTVEITNNLIINYLPQHLSDEEFRNMFLSIGPLKSCKICRDKATGFSYGFGFAEYETDRDAERAQKSFDGLQLYSKRIKVQHANKNDESSKGNNIYVKNIPSDYTEVELDKLFETYGKIKTSKVLMDLQTGTSRNVGFVLYETKAEADKAISELAGKLLPGASGTLILKFADDSSKKKATTPTVPHVMPQLQPFNNHSTFPSQQGNGFTSPTPPGGPMRNQSTNRVRFNPMARDNNNMGSNSNFGGAANMNFNNANNNFQQQQTQNFSNQNNQSNFNSMTSPVISGMASPQMDIPTGPGPFSLFVFNIGDDAEERELWALFSPFGTVQKCTVMMDSEKNVSKGFGFVDMANAMEAVNAIKSLNGFFYKGRQLNVSFKGKRKH